MRVLFLVENESVPTDRRVWDEACILRDSGLDVTVICPTGKQGEQALVENIDGVTIRRFHLKESAGGAKGFLAEYSSALFSMAKLLWRSGPVDAVHLANPPDLLFLLGVMAKLRWRSKIVFDHHDLAPELFASRFPGMGALLAVVKAAERLSFAAADAVVSTNESYRTIAIERGKVPSDRVRVVRNARSAANFAPVAPDPRLRNGKGFLAVYVGAMGPQDGADCAVRVAAHYKHDLGRSDLHIAMVGDGDAKQEAEELAAELDVADMVEFVGWQNRDAVIRYLSTADIGLATDPPNALNNHSTMIKVIEYMAMGLPVVSFDLSESIVTAGDAALYTKGQDEAAMAADLARLIDDPDLRQELRERGLERSEGPLSWETARQALLATYDQVLNRHG